jgi:hypothetical protein
MKSGEACRLSLTHRLAQSPTAFSPVRASLQIRYIPFTDRCPEPWKGGMMVPRCFQWNNGYAPFNRDEWLDACSSADSPCSAGFQTAVSQIYNLQYVAAKMAFKSSCDSLSSRTPFRSMPGRMQFGETAECNSALPLEPQSGSIPLKTARNRHDYCPGQGRRGRRPG